MPAEIRTSVALLGQPETRPQPARVVLRRAQLRSLGQCGVGVGRAVARGLLCHSGVDYLSLTRPGDKPVNERGLRHSLFRPTFCSSCTEGFTPLMRGSSLVRCRSASIRAGAKRRCGSARPTAKSSAIRHSSKRTEITGVSFTPVDGGSLCSEQLKAICSCNSK